MDEIASEPPQTQVKQIVCDSGTSATNPLGLHLRPDRQPGVVVEDERFEQGDAEVTRLEGAISELSEPLHQRLAVLPGWVRSQLEDTVGLLAGAPERVKTEFRRLELRVTMNPIEESGSRFYRAVVVNSVPFLSGTTEMREISATACGSRGPSIGRK